MSLSWQTFTSHRTQHILSVILVDNNYPRQSQTIMWSLICSVLFISLLIIACLCTG